MIHTLTIRRLVMAAGLALWGCAPRPAPSPAAPMPSPLKIHLPAPVINPSTLVEAGLPPLLYLCDSGGPIRIVNATTRQTILTMIVRPRTLISVNSSSGILVGRQKLAKGPLPVGHRFEIWLDPPPPPPALDVPGIQNQ